MCDEWGQDRALEEQMPGATRLGQFQKAANLEARPGCPQHDNNYFEKSYPKAPGFGFR
jgi:hypothetical protein